MHYEASKDSFIIRSLLNLRTYRTFEASSQPYLREHHRSEYEGAVQASTEETPQCSTKRVMSAPVTPQITIQDSLAKAMPLLRNSERYKGCLLFYMQRPTTF